MSRPSLTIVGQETLAERERRLVADARAIGVELTRETLDTWEAALSAAQILANAVSVSPGAREVGRSTALKLQPLVATLSALIARA